MTISQQAREGQLNLCLFAEKHLAEGTFYLLKILMYACHERY